MPPAIFYDLETSDRLPVGQILNYAFVAVDDHYQTLSQLTGSIRLSRLQLPRAGAILSNRINVLEHQEKYDELEKPHLQSIAEFINNYAKKAGDYKVTLIGYNSSGFDLDYLRTSMIRNGINPYFKVTNRDVYLAVQYLYTSNQDFYEKLSADATRNEQEISFKLATIARVFKLLEGEQSHESLADTELTVKLAQTLDAGFDFDVRTHETYDPFALQHAQPGTIIQRLLRSKAKPAEITKVKYCLQSAKFKQGLWINLDTFAKLKAEDSAKSMLSWLKADKSSVVIDREFIPTLEDRESAKLAQLRCAGISLDNYFEETDCDIEQFIYRVAPNEIAPLEALFNGTKQSSQISNDIRALHQRYRLTYYELGSGADEQMREALKSYALYRYGGKMKISKSPKAELAEKDFHPTYQALVEEINSGLKNASPSDRVLLESLLNFYENSEIAAALK